MEGFHDNAGAFIKKWKQIVIMVKGTLRFKQGELFDRWCISKLSNFKARKWRYFI